MEDRTSWSPRNAEISTFHIFTFHRLPWTQACRSCSQKKVVSFFRNVLLIVADDAGRQLGHLGDPLVWPMFSEILIRKDMGTGNLRLLKNFEQWEDLLQGHVIRHETCKKKLHNPIFGQFFHSAHPTGWATMLVLHAESISGIGVCVCPSVCHHFKDDHYFCS